MLEKLREEVCIANRELGTSGLVKLTWGNVSGIDRSSGIMVIKPSGVPYEDLIPENMVLVDMEGNIHDDKLGLRPSSDTPTHIELYKAFGNIGGITHTHSLYAVKFAQARKDIPCLGTTHADHFYGSIPVTRLMHDDEIDNDYEKNTGKVIVDAFDGINPDDMPAVLVANHGPFTWGKDAMASVVNSIVLEEVSSMALETILLNPNVSPIKQILLDKHYLRKHGVDAYYGQER
ncbi:MAG: L-ribulose-5-phosphate 4-epimerase [Kiritimatiellae bacterium]|jgi:L-ribulose-5-phosphate 4-epimerase|nr:L-ribulose-5-phosphate 4-epimerase [Kiritimatiellia bacterium]